MMKTERKFNFVGVGAGFGSSSIILIGIIRQSEIPPWAHFILKFTLKIIRNRVILSINSSSPRAPLQAPLFSLPPKKFHRKNDGKEKASTKEKEKRTKEYSPFFCVYIALENDGEVFVLVLLKFFFFLLSFEKKKPQVKKKNMKNWLVSPFLFLFPWKFNEQSEREAARGGGRGNSEEKIQMWIKLCYLVRIE